MRQWRNPREEKRIGWSTEMVVRIGFRALLKDIAELTWEWRGILLCLGGKGVGRGI